MTMHNQEESAVLPNQPGPNADYIMDLTRKIGQLEYQVGVLEVLTKGLTLLVMDDKGKARINKQVMNKIPKVETLDFHTNDAGAVILSLVMEDGVKPPPKPKAKATPKGKGKK